MNAVLDGLAFQLLGFRGPLGRWAVNRVVNVWCRPIDVPGAPW